MNEKKIKEIGQEIYDNHTEAFWDNSDEDIEKATKGLGLTEKDKNKLQYKIREEISNLIKSSK